MSRFENYINEVLTPYDEDLENIVLTIRDNCKPFLKEWKPSSGFLYRGVKIFHLAIEMKNRRKDRRLRDTDVHISKGIDVVFQKKFGWKPRSEGVFTTGDHLATTIYGAKYLFFPIRRYRYIWSPEVKDFYTMSLSLYNFPGGSEDQEDEYLEKWSREITKTYKSKGLNSAIKSNSEIAFDVDNYFIVDVKFEDDLYKEFK